MKKANLNLAFFVAQRPRGAASTSYEPFSALEPLRKAKI